MFKSVASQKVALYVFDGAGPKTGDAANLTFYVSKDFGAVTALGDTSATELDDTTAPGIYICDLTQAETNADTLIFSGVSATSGVTVEPQIVYTRPPYFSTLDINEDGAISLLGTDALSAAAVDAAAVTKIQSGLALAGAGNGPHSRTVTVTASAVAVSGATVSMTDGSSVYSALTNASGVASFSLATATYILAVFKAGYTHTPASVSVSGAGDTATTITAISITPAANPGRTTGYITCYGSDGEAVGASEVTIYAELLDDGAGTDGSSHYDSEMSGTSDANGLVQITNLLRSRRYRARRGTSDKWHKFTTDDATTTELPEILGHE